MAYSLDFRQQVFNIKEKEGLTFQEVSDKVFYSNSHTFSMAKPNLTKNQTQQTCNKDIYRSFSKRCKRVS